MFPGIVGCNIPTGAQLHPFPPSNAATAHIVGGVQHIQIIQPFPTVLGARTLPKMAGKPAMNSNQSLCLVVKTYAHIMFSSPKCLFFNPRLCQISAFLRNPPKTPPKSGLRIPTKIATCPLFPKKLGPKNSEELRPNILPSKHPSPRRCRAGTRPPPRHGWPVAVAAPPPSSPGTSSQ